MSTAFAPATAAAGAREASRRDDGKFGTQLLGEADVDLGTGATALDINGDPVELTPGVLDERAEYVFQNGQCLALAVALARRNGTGLVVRWDYDDEDPDTDDWVGHVWAAQDPAAAAAGDAALLDVTGADSMGDYTERYYPEYPCEVEAISAEHLDARLPDLEAAMNHPQNYELADSFVDAVNIRGGAR